MKSQEPPAVTRTIRRHELRQIVPLADTTIYDMEATAAGIGSGILLTPDSYRKMTAPDLRGTTFRFESRSGLFSLRYALLDATGRQVGTLTETTGFSLWKRSFRFDLPDGIDGATGVFLFFLMVNMHFR